MPKITCVIMAIIKHRWNHINVKIVDQLILIFLKFEIEFDKARK